MAWGVLHPMVAASKLDGSGRRLFVDPADLLAECG